MCLNTSVNMVFVVFVVLTAVAWVLAQPGGSSSNMCDMCGASTTYSEQLQTLTLNGATLVRRRITANGCPNHCALTVHHPA